MSSPATALASSGNAACGADHPSADLFVNFLAQRLPVLIVWLVVWRARVSVRYADLRISLRTVRKGRRSARAFFPVGRHTLPALWLDQTHEKTFRVHVRRRRRRRRTRLHGRAPFLWVMRDGQAAFALSTRSFGRRRSQDRGRTPAGQAQISPHCTLARFSTAQSGW